MTDVRQILDQLVYIRGENRPFAELTTDDVRSRADAVNPGDDVLDLLRRRIRFHHDHHQGSFPEIRWKLRWGRATGETNALREGGGGARAPQWRPLAADAGPCLEWR